MRHEKKSRAIPALVRQHGKPLFKVVFDVFGVYTWGNLAGKVNPKSHAEVVFYGEDFKDCKNKLVDQTDGIFFKPKEIVDLNPLYSAAYDALQKAHKEFAKKFAVVEEAA